MSTLSDVQAALDALIAFDTTSRLSNLPLITWLEEQIGPHAAFMQRMPNAAGDKANLWVRIGPDEPGGVVLSGHTDVVPVDGQPWETAPFTLTARDDKLFGRGTADMKSFVALCAAFAPTFGAAPLKRPIHMAFSYDEEVGCTGSPAMVEAIAQSEKPPAIAWIGEPTLWTCMSGHKAIETWEVEVIGHEAHSSLPDHGVSAIHEALDLMNMLRVIAMQAETEAPADSPFDPPHATLTIGLVQGGTASNILARQCGFTFDLRAPPGVDTAAMLTPFFDAAKQIDERIKALFPDCGVRFTKRSSTPAMAPVPESAAESFIRGLTGDNSSHFASYAAEAGQFQTAGMATVICGPGSIEQAHQPNEWIARSELEKGVEIFSKIAGQLC